MKGPIVIDPAVLQVEGIRALEHELAAIRIRDAQSRTPRGLSRHEQ